MGPPQSPFSSAPEDSNVRSGSRVTGGLSDSFGKLMRAGTDKVGAQAALRRNQTKKHAVLVQTVLKKRLFVFDFTGNVFAY